MFNSRRSSILVFVLLLCGNGLSKEKKVAILPDVVINAQTVAVVIMPNVAEPISNPNLNRNAQSDVENALVKWGRLRPVISTQDADLVIAIRKGTKGATPTVHGGGVDDRPVILQPGESDARIAVQRGTPPSTSQTQAPSPVCAIRARFRSLHSGVEARMGYSNSWSEANTWASAPTHEHHEWLVHLERRGLVVG
jgi:hypothetical protein